ncbi:unnamed protein product [Cunninghamella blakesleeana]
MPDNTVILEKLKSLNKSQDTRIALYQEFDEAYQDYLVDKCPTEQYYSICKIVTEGFQEVSLEIQAIEKELTEKCRRPDLSSLIRQLQEAEKEKLNHTAHLQIYTIESRKGDKDYDTAIIDSQKGLSDALTNIQNIWDEIRSEMMELAYD